MDLYLLIVDRKNKQLMQRLYNWYTGGPKRRYVSPGVIIDRPSTNSLLMSEDQEALVLVHYLKGRKRKAVRVFRVEELSWPDLKEEISKSFKRGSEES